MLDLRVVVLRAARSKADNSAAPRQSALQKLTRGGGGGPNCSGEDVPLAPLWPCSLPTAFADMGDDSPPWVVETQETLGRLIKRPKLTDALLMKPPFRFLHDIITEVTKETGFANGLYTEEHETKSGNIKDKESKMAYLTKAIKCVEYAIGVTINIRVAKVVAGLEAENTNAFLQSLYQAATSVPDSSTAVSRVLAETDGPAPPAPPPPSHPADAHDGGAPPPQAPPALAPPQADPMANAAPERDAVQMSSQPMRKPEEESAAPAEEGTNKRVRPKSARRPPPRVTSNEVKVDKAAPRGGEAAPVAGVIMEGDAGDDDAGTIEMVDTQGEQQPSMGPVGEAGDVQGRLMKNLLQAKDEMEVTSSEREKVVDLSEGQSETQGIILGKKPGKGNDRGGKGVTSKTEVSALRNSIQTLCQSSNPLGRCLEYVQEDLEAMGKELEGWRTLRHRRAGELADEEASTTSALIGLKSELEKVEEMIKEKQVQVRFTKASIIKNDAQIERLLSQVVRA